MPKVVAIENPRISPEESETKMWAEPCPDGSLVVWARNESVDGGVCYTLCRISASGIRIVCSVPKGLGISTGVGGYVTSYT